MLIYYFLILFSIMPSLYRLQIHSIGSIRPITMFSYLVLNRFAKLLQVSDSNIEMVYTFSFKMVLRQINQYMRRTLNLLLLCLSKSCRDCVSRSRRLSLAININIQIFRSFQWYTGSSPATN